MISSLLHLVGLRPQVYYTLTNFWGRAGARPPWPPPQYDNVSCSYNLCTYVLGSQWYYACSSVLQVGKKSISSIIIQEHLFAMTLRNSIKEHHSYVRYLLRFWAKLMAHVIIQYLYNHVSRITSSYCHCNVYSALSKVHCQRCTAYN